MPSRLLQPDEIDALLATYPDWLRDGQRLTRTFRFASFDEAFAFMTDVAKVSAELNHHPDWSNQYARVDIAITDHDAGGLSDNDRRWVAAVEALR